MCCAVLIEILFLKTKKRNLTEFMRLSLKKNISLFGKTDPV